MRRGGRAGPGRAKPGLLTDCHRLVPAVGHAVLAINGAEVNGRFTADGKDVLEFLGNPANYPVSIRFGRHRLSSNEKLMLASMFHS